MIHAKRIAHYSPNTGWRVTASCSLVGAVKEFSRAYSDISYSKTLNLPKSSFPPRAKAKDTARFMEAVSEPLYKWQFENLPDSTKKVFHDGPPYANGDLHMGHALNKILKDIVNRYNVISGHKVEYRPGWDCHGLPIELKALELASKKHGGGAVKKYSIQKKRQLARQLATSMIERQKDSFKGYAIMADWSDKNIYKTLSPDYVLRQLVVFKQMFERGLISRQDKPVYWSTAAGTALAEAELEYRDHISQAITVKYPFVPSDDFRAFVEDKLGSDVAKNLNLAIWTTTPWTLVANRAISMNPKLSYTIVRLQSGSCFICIDNDVDTLSQTFGDTVEKLNVSFTGDKLEGSFYKCLLRNENQKLYPVLGAAYVTASTGTGLVHNAPGHGHDDYLVCKEHGILPYSPVDGEGRYTEDLPECLQSLVGLRAREEGQQKVIELCNDVKATIRVETVEHSVQYDSRSRVPIIIRSTPQFFADVGSIKGHALQSLDHVNFYPLAGRSRLEAFIKMRQEWCISRQRVWGVPIPVLYKKEDHGEVLITNESIDHIINVIKSYGENGIEKWFEEQDDVSEWLPSNLNGCGLDYVKGVETMDVWFDSGTSWTMLQNKGDDEPPADYYLEGSDQHRGWFQSSLLTKIAVSGKPVAPYKNIITHGFTLDEKGQKMSKSLGNVVSPQEVMNGLSKQPGKNSIGVDGLRFWVAQSDYNGDVKLSPASVQLVATSINKLRVTYKFILGNLSHYNGSEEISYSKLRLVDRWMLSTLANLSNKIQQLYIDFAFNRIVQTLVYHMNTHLSAFYFDVIKDRLYADTVDGYSRISAQFVLCQILKTYASVLAPLTPVLSQEVWHHAPEYVKEGFDSPFKAGWPKIDQSFIDETLEEEFTSLAVLRSGINVAAQQGRSDK